jgi:dipeptidyl aminopeptidase/acylaminoacyl peptidase
MLWLALLAAASEDLPAKLRHLESVASAEAPASSPDGARIAFVTTLFGTRQVATMAADGSYPMQLTDEPGGVLGVRYAPNDPKVLIAIALRGDRRRLLFVDEEGTPAVEIDPAPGDQFPGGFTRDGKRFFYAVADGAKISLRQLPLDTRKPVEVIAPPPAAGPVQAPAGSSPLAESLAGLWALGPPTPDGRTVVAAVRRGGNEGLVLVDLATARGEIIAPLEGRFRSPRFSPDGRTLYVLTDAGRKTMGVDAIAMQGRARKTVYAPPYDLEAYAVSEDGHRLAVAAEQEGETIFSLLELSSLRAQPLAAPPGGALAPVANGEAPLSWTRAGDRLLFGWRLSDDTTDVWALRIGYGTPLRLTRSPRPSLPRDSIPRPKRVSVGWLWMPAVETNTRPRLAVLISPVELRPVFDKRIAALNFAGLAVLAVNGPAAQKAALEYIRTAPDLDTRKPVLIDLDGGSVEQPAAWAAVVKHVDADHPDLRALLKEVGALR